MILLKLKILFSTIVLFIACTPAPPTSTFLRPDGVTIDLQHIAATFSGKIISATPNGQNTAFIMDGTPAHLRFTFDNERLPKIIDYRERQLLLYPINAYRELFGNNSKEQIRFDNQIRHLKRVIFLNSKRESDAIPVFPPVENIQVFCSQIRRLDFENGSGVRFISSYAMEVSLTTNETIFYTYQGLSSDGSYYISVFYPIASKDLVETSDVFTTINFLNQQAPADFTPDLSALDAMIESLHVAEPLQKIPNQPELDKFSF